MTRDERPKILWATIIGYIHPTLARILGYDPDHPEISDTPGDCIVALPDLPEKFDEESIKWFSDTLAISMVEMPRSEGNKILEEACWFRAVGDDENEINEEYIRELCRFKALASSNEQYEIDMTEIAKDAKAEFVQAMRRIVETADYADGVTDPPTEGDEFSITCPACLNKALSKVSEEYVMDDKLVHYQCCTPSCEVKFVVSYGKPIPPELSSGVSDEYLFYATDEVEHNVDRLAQYFADTMSRGDDYTNIKSYEDFIDDAKECGWPEEAIEEYESDLRIAWAKVINERLENII